MKILKSSLYSCVGLFGIQTMSFAADEVTKANYKPASANACVALETNSERLKCYDNFYNHTPTNVALNKRDQSRSSKKLKLDNDPALSNTLEVNIEQRQAENSSAADMAIEATKTPVDLPAEAQQVAAAPTTKISKIKDSLFSKAKNWEWIGQAPDFDPNTSLLDRRWELSEQSKLGTWQMRGNKPVYVLPIFITSDKNETPTSPNPDNQVTTAIPSDSTESKFQFSFKTKALENIFGDNGDLWIGYTQSSRWQVYNEDESRPFRETNYEPEASLMFRTNYDLFGLNGRLLGVSLNHQSNGRSLPLSRSWNRVIFNVGLEKDNFALMLRPWIRLSEEKASKDDNRDISDYMGRGDLTGFYRHNDNEFSLMLRHSLKDGDKSHGAVQFDWSFPLQGALRGHFQYFTGYGESMIDYNHKADYFGLGVSLLNWF